MKFKSPLAAAIVSLVVCVSALAQKMVFQGKVTGVIDGSTVVVETQSKTKFVVKCQATTVPRRTESYADSARERLSKLVLKQMVAVEYAERDKDGQLLGTIFLNGQDVCLDQIAAGLGWYDPQAPNNLTTSRRELYASREAIARSSGTGAWANSTAAMPASNVLNNNITTEGRTPTSVNPSAASSVVAPNAANNSGTVDVRGYFRKDGTYVPRHKRTEPDTTVDNNWTTLGNTNPYTGKPGTKSWFARHWWIVPTIGAVVGTGFWLSRSMSTSTSSGGFIPCNDGTISHALNRQGACSHHGGIR